MKMHLEKRKKNHMQPKKVACTRKIRVALSEEENLNIS